MKSWGVCSVDNADCHGCENEFEFEKFLQPLAIIEYHSHKVSQKRDNSEFIFLSIGIIIEKKRESSTLDVTREYIFRIDKYAILYMYS